MRGCRDMRNAVKLSTSSMLLALASLICLPGLIGEGEAVKDKTILGGAVGKPWKGGGGGIEPVFIAGPKEVGTGNTPGGVIDFDYTTTEGETKQGWLFPESADRTENIALGLLGRGGSVTAPTVLENITTELQTMIDNDGETAFERKSTEFKMVNALGVVMQFDLGSRFGVSRIKFFPRNADPDYPTPELPFQDDYLKAYEILLNDGTEETQSGGLPVFTSIALEPQNDEPVVDLEIEPQYVRFLRVRSETTAGFEIAEVQVFGEGFVPVASYLSDIFDFTDLALWGNIRWQQENAGDPFRSVVEVSTRSGLDDTPLVFNRIRVEIDQEQVPWKKADDFDAGTAERTLVSQLEDLSVREAKIEFNTYSLEERNAISITQDYYYDTRKMKDAEKGVIREDIVNWSLWTPPYSPAGIASADSVAEGKGGIRIVSPGPRRYFQVRINFASEELFSAKGIGALSFDYARPVLAEEIIAEISPRQTNLGEVTEFSYTLVPDIRPGVDQGFSALEITTPVKVGSIEKIELTLPDGISTEADFSQEDLSALTAPVQKGGFSVDRVESNYFRISFPKIEASRIETEKVSVLGLTFKGVVLRTGTAFSSRVLPEDEENELPQVVVGGNAVELSEGGTLIRNPADLTVQVPIKGNLLVNITADPEIITPNGDRTNDVTRINYDITSLTGGADITVCIHDLSGRLVKEVYAGSDKSGRYSKVWDGTDAQGKVVPPGIYIFRLEIQADAGSEEASGTIAVAY